MSFPGATVEDMVDFVKPIIRKRPKKIILHVGTNNLKRDNPKKIGKKIIDLANDLKKQHSSVEIAIHQLYIERMIHCSMLELIRLMSP
jgi:3-methyladenine DNA glycosylase AlkC